MIFYRRNALSDKAISFLAMLLAVVMIYSNIQVYKVLGIIHVTDLIIGISCIGIGTLFLYTSKIKYLEITSNQITWYTWFFIKHTLTKEQIKDITTKKRYFIISKKKGTDIWLSKLYIRKEDDEKVNEALKALIEGK